MKLKLKYIVVPGYLDPQHSKSIYCEKNHKTDKFDDEGTTVIGKLKQEAVAQEASGSSSYGPQVSEKKGSTAISRS